MTLNELYERSQTKHFDLRRVLPALRALNEGAMNDVLNTNGCFYYQWLPRLIDTIHPKQIVELGGAMGVSALLMLHAHDEPEVYSITLPEQGLEYSFVQDTFPHFHPILGNDLDVENFKGVDLKETDLWFFDALHTTEHLNKELALYTPFFKKGAILLFDDIHMDEIWPIWDSLPYEKKDISDPCHYSGFGIARV